MVALDRDPAGTGPERHVVVQADGLEQGAQLVVAVAPPAQDLQPEVDLREGRDLEGLQRPLQRPLASAAWTLLNPS